MTNRFTRAPGLHVAGIRLTLALALAAVAPTVHAQVDDDPDGPVTVSRPVVQSTAPSPSRELNAALARLAADPRNVAALYDASEAAMRLGDSDAAIGFLTRANEIQPGNPRSNILIGKAYLLAENPVDAVRAFDEAERAGADTFVMAADRALAYDLVGDNGRAQRWYPVALSRGPDDEVTRRYALSLAISGDRRGAEALIAPLINRQDRPTWRTRTFVMAVTGGPDEAVAVAYASMPQDLAAGIAPYLRYMPRLTPAQQAAAANFGRFPRAADIGRDDMRIAQYAAANPRGLQMAGAGLIPSGAALGPNAGSEKPSREKRRRPGREERQLASAATARPGRVQAASITPVPQSAVVAPRPTSSTVSTQSSAPVRVEPQRVTTPAPKPAVLSVLDLPPGAPRPGFSNPAPSARPPLQPAPPSPSRQAVPVAPLQVPSGAVPTPNPVSPSTTRPSLGAPFGFDLARIGGTAGAPAPQSSAPVPANPSQDQVASIAPMPTPAPTPAPTTTPEPAPISALAQTSVPASSASEGVPESGTPPTRPADFASLFKTFAPPAEERQTPVEAVDITQIAPKAVAKPPKADPRGERPDGPTDVSRTSAKEPEKPGAKDAKAAAKDPKAAAKAAKDAKDAKEAKAKKAAPSHPSRIWVQVLTGANKDMMDNEWRRLMKDAPDAFRGRKPYISPWRSNFRLLTGPFESEASAQEFITRLRKGGVSSYQWTSPAGQAVDTLALK